MIFVSRTTRVIRGVGARCDGGHFGRLREWGRDGREMFRGRWSEGLPLTACAAPFRVLRSEFLAAVVAAIRSVSFPSI